MCVCVCVCVCERERERERELTASVLKKELNLSCVLDPVTKWLGLTSVSDGYHKINGHEFHWTEQWSS